MTQETAEEKKAREQSALQRHREANEEQKRRAQEWKEDKKKGKSSMIFIAAIIALASLSSIMPTRSVYAGPEPIITPSINEPPHIPHLVFLPLVVR